MPDGLGMAGGPAIGRRSFLKGAAGLAGARALAGLAGGGLAGAISEVLAGCADSRGRAGGARPTIRILSWTSLGFPSAFTYVAGPGYWRMSLIFDTLTWPDSTGQQLPWLASSYQLSPDGMTYTVDLRDVTWTDGRPVTARDVAFTYQYYVSKAFTPLLIGVPHNDADVVPVGDRRVEFRLKKPDATFLEFVLGTMPIVPEHVFSSIDDPQGNFDNKVLTGTGAYTLASRNETQDNELYVARDKYFLGPPHVRRIEMVPAEDPITALRLGQLDAAATAVEGVRNEIVDPFRKDPAYGITSQQGGWGFPLFFNLSRGGALADIRFRRACLHAINREDLVDRLLTGNGQPGSQGFLSPDNQFYNADVRTYPFDRDEAERLMDEAGYRRAGGNGDRTNPDGSAIKYSLYMPDTVPEALAELVVANLKDVGIPLDLNRIDLVRLFGTKLQGAYDLLLTSYPGPTGIGPNGDPEQLRGIYYTNPPSTFQKATGYSNPEVDQLIDAQSAATDLDERKRLVGRIQQIVADDLPVAMLYYTTMYFVFRKSVFDQWYYTPGGFGPGISDVYNKQAYIVGKKTGTQIA